MMRIFSCLALIFCLTACNKPAPNTLVVGTISGAETTLVETAKQVAEEKHGLHIKIVEFNDYNLPNAALEDGSLDVNVYQHLPYLKAAMVAHGYHLQPVGKTFVYPMGIYSSKIKSLSKLPKKAIVALPNDPSNEARALLLLHKAGLISIKDKGIGGIQDIQSNPKQLQFKEMDAAQLPRILPDVDIAVINTTFAIPAGLSPSRDALFIETKDSPYANLIVAKKDSPKKSQIDLFIKSINSEEVKAKAKELFGDSALPAW